MFRQAIVRFRLYVNQSANHTSQARQESGNVPRSVHLEFELNQCNVDSDRERRSISSPIPCAREQAKIQVNKAE